MRDLSRPFISLIIYVLLGAMLAGLIGLIMLRTDGLPRLGWFSLTACWLVGLVVASPAAVDLHVAMFCDQVSASLIGFAGNLLRAMGLELVSLTVITWLIEPQLQTKMAIALIGTAIGAWLLGVGLSLARPGGRNHAAHTRHAKRQAQ